MWGWCLWGGRDGGSTWALNYPSSHGPAAAGEHVLTPSPDAPAGPWGSHPPLPPPDPLPTTRLLFSPLSTVLPPSPPVTYCTLSQPSSIYGPQSPVSCQPRPILLHFVPFFLLRARCAPISLPSASSRAAALSALWVIDP